jgi:hypothetical protein
MTNAAPHVPPACSGSAADIAYQCFAAQPPPGDAGIAKSGLDSRVENG